MSHNGSEASRHPPKLVTSNRQHNGEVDSWKTKVLKGDSNTDNTEDRCRPVNVSLTPLNSDDKKHTKPKATALPAAGFAAVRALIKAKTTGIGVETSSSLNTIANINQGTGGQDGRKEDSEEYDSGGEHIGALGRAMTACVAGNFDTADVWLLDSGANVHLITDRKWFRELHDFSVVVNTADREGQPLQVEGGGVAEIPVRYGSRTRLIRLQDCVYCPSSRCSLLSVGLAAIENKIFSYFTDKYATLTLNDVPIARGKLDNGLYHLDVDLTELGDNNTRQIPDAPPAHGDNDYDDWEDNEQDDKIVECGTEDEVQEAQRSEEIEGVSSDETEEHRNDNNVVVGILQGPAAEARTTDSADQGHNEVNDNDDSLSSPEEVVKSRFFASAHRQTNAVTRAQKSRTNNPTALEPQVVNNQDNARRHELDDDGDSSAWEDEEDPAQAETEIEDEQYEDFPSPDPLVYQGDDEERRVDEEDDEDEVVTSPGGSDGAAGIQGPVHNGSAEGVYSNSFPDGHRLLVTPSTGLMCSLHALRRSIISQYPEQEPPSIDELKVVMIIAKIEDDNNLADDQIHRILKTWSESTSIPMRLGVLVEGEGPRFVANVENPATVEGNELKTVWIYNDNMSSRTHAGYNVLNHWSGMEKKPSHRDPDDKRPPIEEAQDSDDTFLNQREVEDDDISAFIDYDDESEDSEFRSDADGDDLSPVKARSVVRPKKQQKNTLYNYFSRQPQVEEDSYSDVFEDTVIMPLLGKRKRKVVVAQSAKKLKTES